MIIESYNLGNTRIKIDDSYKAKTEEEKKIYIDNFNRAGNEVLRTLLNLKEDKNK